jgi:sRNA-binding regulator protein Hfq
MNYRGHLHSVTNAVTVVQQSGTQKLVYLHAREDSNLQPKDMEKRPY